MLLSVAGAFVLNGPQGCIAVNSVQNLGYVADHMAEMLKQMRQSGHSRFEARQEAEDAYCSQLYEQSTKGQKFYASCTPGWYNNDGSFKLGKTLNTSYGTALAFGEMLEQLRATGEDGVFTGLEVR